MTLGDRTPGPLQLTHRPCSARSALEGMVSARGACLGRGSKGLAKHDLVVPVALQKGSVPVGAVIFRREFQLRKKKQAQVLEGKEHWLLPPTPSRTTPCNPEDRSLYIEFFLLVRRVPDLLTLQP